MSNQTFNWNDIRTINGSQNNSFEEFVCQLAKNEFCKNGAKYTRIGKPDGGRECFIEFPDGAQFHFQAKYFTSSFSETQFTQIDKSVKSDIDHFKNVTKYYIAFPMDLPGGVVNGKKSCLEKWDDYVKDWEDYARKQSETIKFVRWDSSELISLLIKTENAGLQYFFFNKQIFTPEWFKAQNEKSIKDLQDRYTPECNINIEINDLIKCIYEPDSVKDCFFDELQRIEKLFSDISASPIYVSVINGIKNLLSIARGINFDDLNNFSFQFEEVKAEFNKLQSEIPIKDDDEKNQELLSFIQYLIGQIYNLFNTFDLQMFFNPYVLIYGKGGTGKSHLIAQTVSEINSKGEPCIFLLGQHFVGSKTIWNQIFDILQLTCNTSEEFLSALNATGISLGKRIIVFIDAINESYDTDLWKNNVSSFLSEFKKYKNLGIVFTLRSEYEKIIFPEEYFKTSELNRIEHSGFEDFEIRKAIDVYKNQYTVSLPKDITWLYRDCKNPMFLNVIFKTFQNKSIPDGPLAINKLIELYIQKINEKVSNNLNCSVDIHIVNEFIKQFIKTKLEQNDKYMEYKKTCELSVKLEKQYSLKSSILQELLSQGIFYKNIINISDSEPFEYIFFEFNKLEDYYMASLLCSFSQTELIKKKQFLEKNISISSMYFYLYCLKNKRENQILFNNNYYSSLFDAFFASFEYRSDKDFGSNAANIISNGLKNSKNLVNYYDLCIKRLCSNEILPFINELNIKLLSMTITDRDEIFIPHFMNNYYEKSDIWKIANYYCCISKPEISKNTENTCLLISWFLLSSNRSLRDNATKTLIYFLKSDISCLLKLLRIFENIDDPYIYERLFAVAYGCVIRTDKISELSDLGNYIYQRIFNTRREVYPNILLRDYARNCLEYIASRGIKLNVSWKKVRPPYKSYFPLLMPSNKSIDKKIKKNKFNMIISSMTTEYGRGCCMYGDFGRYVFQSALSHWKVNYDKLSNWCILQIYKKYHYDKKPSFLEFDKGIGTGRSRNSGKNERIGKKYQWIMFYEALARTADNKRPIKKSSEFSYNKYNGTWIPCVRNIDPTIFIRNIKDTVNGTCKFLKNQINYDSWSIPDWGKSISDLPDIKSILFQNDANNKPFLLLDGFVKWQEIERDYNSKEIWYNIHSYCVKSKEFNSIKIILNQKDFYHSNNRIMEPSRLYEVFSREYFWSPAYKDFNTEYQDHLESRIIYDNQNQEIGTIYPTCNDYLWESEFDCSKDDSISFKKPSALLFDKINMLYAQKEGELVDKTGQIICFDPSVNNPVTSVLLIDENSMKDFLQKQGYEIFWTVFGEKHGKGVFEGFSGFYYLDNGVLKGNIKHSNKEVNNTDNSVEQDNLLDEIIKAM